jgi:integrase
MKVVIAQDVKENGLWDQDYWPNQTQAIVQSALATTPVKPNLSILELIERYHSRNNGRHALKTSYEYEKMQRRFLAWISAKKNNDRYPLRDVMRGDIAEFIDELQKENVSLQTIQKKYLAALNGLFDYGQSAGEYPAGELPTRNHKIYTSRDKKKSALKDGWKHFSDEDLSLIFNPTNYLARAKPDDYWLPLLGLFTGGRISELCQLKPHNIRQIEGIWSIDINEDDKDQSVKTEAGIRLIPIHPKLIELGFLDYVEDAKAYGGTIFPFLNLDAFNNYSKAPSRRFGEYLHKLTITDDRKVFHSFRFTANNRLKENGVGEESRCQFVGHEHDTVNSERYSDKHGIRFLLDSVAIHLTFSCVKFDELAYPRELMKERLCLLMKKKEKFLAHKAAKETRSKS